MAVDSGLSIRVGWEPLAISTYALRPTVLKVCAMITDCYFTVIRSSSSLRDIQFRLKQYASHHL